jgi:hypothetical protein
LTVAADVGVVVEVVDGWREPNKGGGADVVATITFAPIIPAN